MPMIASDGSSLGTNTDEGRKGEGPGAFAVTIRFEDDHPIVPAFSQTMTGGKRSTTTGEIELMGFLAALETVRAHHEARLADPSAALVTEHDRFTIVLDSEYVVKGYLEHLKTWLANEWRTSGFRAIKNQILWQDVHALSLEIGHLVTIVHQRGHTRRAADVEVHPHVQLNDVADKAAGRASRAIRDTGFIPQPHPIVWRSAAEVQTDRGRDIRMLQSLAERVLTAHGRGAAVEAFRLATMATGIKE